MLWWRCLRNFAYENVLGTSLELRIQARSARRVSAARDAALAEIDRLELIFSSFNPQSALSRWQQAPRGTPVSISSELYKVLEQAQRWHAWSGGVFHPGAESLTRLWKEAALRGSPPTEAERSEVLGRLAEPLWSLDRAGGSVTRHTRCALTFNALAKGYIVDQACSVAMQVSGVEGVLLSIGGDLSARGSLASVVAVTDPEHDGENATPLTRVRLVNAAMATSGGYRRGFQVGEHWHSHLLDPRTGQPTEPLQSVSIIAPTAMEADALATICSLLPPEESLHRVEELPGCAVFIACPGEQHLKSARWSENEMPGARKR